jgi:hypothetical protein
LRKSPGTNSLILTLIPKGTSVEVGKCSNGWCQASLNGQDGYVIAQNVGMATARRAPRGPMVTEEIVDEEYGPPAGFCRLRVLWRMGIQARLGTALVAAENHLAGSLQGAGARPPETGPRT